MQGVVQEQQGQRQYQPGTVVVVHFFGIMCCVIAGSPHQVVSSSFLVCGSYAGDWRYEVRRALWEQQQQLEQQERAGTNCYYCALDTMGGFPTISRHCIVCIELREEMKELRKQNVELKETVRKLTETMEEMKEKWEQWEQW